MDDKVLRDMGGELMRTRVLQALREMMASVPTGTAVEMDGPTWRACLSEVHRRVNRMPLEGPGGTA